jgi:hypothetical protein
MPPLELIWVVKKSGERKILLPKENKGHKD